MYAFESTIFSIHYWSKILSYFSSIFSVPNPTVWPFKRELVNSIIECCCCFFSVWFKIKFWIFFLISNLRDHGNKRGKHENYTQFLLKFSQSWQVLSSFRGSVAIPVKVNKVIIYSFLLKYLTYIPMRVWLSSFKEGLQFQTFTKKSILHLLRRISSKAMFWKW